MQQKWILPSSTIMAMAVSFALFVFMANLISKPGTIEVGPAGPRPIIEYQPKKSAPLVPKDPIKLKAFKPSTPPPSVTNISKAEPPAVNDNPIDFKPISINGMPGIDGTGSGSHSGVQAPLLTSQDDSDAVAISRIEPMYPAPAAQKGLEGWVKLSFDIDQTGAVINVAVLDAEPKRVFDQAAIKALKRWRYRAKSVDGLPVIQHGKVIVLEFNLDK